MEDSDADLEKMVARFLQETGLNINTPTEDITAEHIAKLAETFGRTLEELTQEYIARALGYRRIYGVSPDGKYNTPDMRELDLLISKLGYAFDAEIGTYVRKDLSQIVIPLLSEKGEQIVKRQQEEAAISNSQSLAQIDLIKQVFSYDDPILPTALITNKNASVADVKNTLIHYLSSAKEIRLLGFDYFIDASPKVQEAYRQAVKNGAKLSIIYHPKVYNFKLDFERKAQKKCDSFIDLLSTFENTKLCRLEPVSETIYGAIFVNALYWNIKLIDDKLLVVNDHFCNGGRFRQIIENSQGIPGIKEGYHGVFDRFFEGDPPYELRPKGGQVTLHTGNGHTYIAKYE